MIKIGNFSFEIRNENSPFVPKWDDSFWIDEAALEILAYSIAKDKNCMLIGPTGCGKSTLVRNFAALINQPIRRINFTRDTRVADIIGEKTLDKNKNVVFEDGLLTQCARNGWWFLIDEIDSAPAGVLLRMQSILENQRQLVLSENDREEVAIHKDFRVISTSNTKGQGDDCGQYAGTHVVNVATLNRFACVIEMTFPPRDQEIAIAQAKSGISKEDASKIIEIASFVRRGFDNEETSFIFSTRNVVDIATLAVETSLKKALKYCVLNRASKSDAKYIDEVAARII